MAKIGNFLKTYFDEQKMTHKVIASHIGTSPAYVTNILNDKQELGGNAAKKWSDAFGFSYTFLLTGEGTLFDSQNQEQQVIEQTEKDLSADLDPQSAAFWKAKYEESEREVQRLNGVIQGLQMALGLPMQKSNVG